VFALLPVGMIVCKNYKRLFYCIFGAYFVSLVFIVIFDPWISSPYPAGNRIVPTRSYLNLEKTRGGGAGRWVVRLPEVLLMG
jgi:hypothetical protein